MSETKDSPLTPVGSPSTILGSPRTVTGSPGTIIGDDESEDQTKSPKPETFQASFQIQNSQAEKNVDEEEPDDFEHDDATVFKAPKLIPLVGSRAYGVKPITYRRNSRGTYRYAKAQVAPAECAVSGNEAKKKKPVPDEGGEEFASKKDDRRRLHTSPPPLNSQHKPALLHHDINERLLLLFRSQMSKWL